MHLIGQLVEYAPQKIGRDHAFGTRVEFGKHHFTGAVDGHEEILLALLGLHFGEIDVQIADGMVFEFLFRRSLPVFTQRQAADAVALKAAVRGRTRKAGNRGLQGVETIVEGQQGVAAKGNGDGLFRPRQHRGGRFRTHSGVL